ncbi:hypothetical protein GCM10010327_10100 [Streptomyces nitrosporeus]|nr:hypothetical protein GCM10010327_10100 [Streptomyces nitrosporeus]
MTPDRQQEIAETAVPELLAEVERLRAEVSDLASAVTGACLARYEEEQDADRLRVALASAQRGRRELRGRVAELEAQSEKVLAFCAQRAEYITSILNCHPNNKRDYNRWQGHAEARRQLSQSLGLPVSWPAETDSHDAPEAAPEAPAVTADRWNSQYPVGTPVTAYPGCRPEDDPKAERLVTRTRSTASVLGGHTAVVWVDGHSSCISLTHVDPGGTS